MDGHNSNFTSEIFDLATENNISIIQFPSNTTHLTQPLDASFFRILKDGIRSELLKVREKTGLLAKSDIPALLEDPWRKATCRGTILSSFEIPGIYPLKYKFDLLFKSNSEKLKTILNSELACTSKKEEIITPSTATINLPTQFISTSTVNFALSDPFSSNNVVLPNPFSFNNNTSSVFNSTYNSKSSSTSFPMHSTISLTQNQIEIDLEEIKNVISKEIKKQFEQQAQATRQKKRDSSNSTKAGNVFTYLVLSFRKHFIFCMELCGK